MHSEPAISVEALREVILSTAADKASDQTETGRAAARSAAIEYIGALASKFSQNELLREMALYLNQIKRA